VCSEGGNKKKEFPHHRQIVKLLNRYLYQIKKRIKKQKSSPSRKLVFGFFMQLNFGGQTLKDWHIVLGGQA
jgi:hypothetical protein